MVRQQIRPKDGWMTAVPVEQPGQVVRRPNGSLVVAQPGQYEVRLNGQVLDVVDEKTLQQQYDVREEGSLAVPGPIRRQIADRLGIGSTNTAADLLKAVERIATLKIGEVEIPVTPGQWEELSHRAQKNGRSVVVEVQQIAKRLEDELFHGGVGRGIGGRV